MEKICCVYKLTNTVDGKFYIGSTFNLHSRLKYHRYSHQHNPNHELANAIAKYGWKAFSVEVLEECTHENVRDRERFYIEKYDAVNKGYNMTEATRYSDWMKSYNAKKWKDAAYREERSKASSELQKRRLESPEYLAEKSRQLKRYTDSIKRPIGMYSKDGKLLRTFSGAREASRWMFENGYGKNANSVCSNICDCCNPSGRHRTAQGFVWHYL